MTGRNLLAEVRRTLGIDKPTSSEVMIVIDRDDVGGTITLDNQRGGRITIPGVYALKQRLIISAGQVVGRAENPSITIWID